MTTFFRTQLEKLSQRLKDERFAITPYWNGCKLFIYVGLPGDISSSEWGDRHALLCAGNPIKGEIVEVINDEPLAAITVRFGGAVKCCGTFQEHDIIWVTKPFSQK